MESASAAAIAVIMLLFFFCIYFVILGIVIANYVMQAYGVYKLASRRGVDHPWMAWIPVAQNWTVGALAEQYDVRRKKAHPWKKILIIMAVVNVVAAVIASFASYMVSIVTAAVGSNSIIGAGNDEIVSVAGIAILFGYMLLVSVLIAIVEMAFYYCRILCIFKIFESTVPEKALKYIILYVLVPLAGGICLLKCKDKGYPYPISPECVVEQPVSDDEEIEWS